MNLIYSIIAFTCLAAGSAVKPVYSNSSAATSASVTTVNSSSITYLATTLTSSAMTNYSSINSTDNIPIGIRKWTGKNCTGQMFENKNLTSLLKANIYNANVPYSSFRISRPLRGREQLDFSRELGTDWCGNFLHSYWPRTSPVGCVNFGTFRCVRIWLN